MNKPIQIVLNNELIAVVSSHESAKAVLRLMNADVGHYLAFDLKNPKDYDQYEEYFE